MRGWVDKARDCAACEKPLEQPRRSNQRYHRACVPNRAEFDRARVSRAARGEPAPHKAKASRTVSLVVLQRQVLGDDAIEGDEGLAHRPATRGDCQHGPRPCPFASCRHHLYLDPTDVGSIKLNYPDVEPEDMDQLEETCSLDVADRGGATLEEVGEIFQLSRERVRQVEAIGLLKMKAEGFDFDDEDVGTVKGGR